MGGSGCLAWTVLHLLGECNILWPTQKKNTSSKHLLYSRFYFMKVYFFCLKRDPIFWQKVETTCIWDIDHKRCLGCCLQVIVINIKPLLVG